MIGLPLALTALALATLGTALGIRVARMRQTERVGIGNGEHRRLHRAIRAHGNFAEWAPLGLLALLIADLRGAPPVLVGVLGAGLVAGRAAHAWGLSRSSGASVGRLSGMLLTILATIAAAVAALF